MASKNIKGITIEIGGNTTKLQDALKGVDKQVYSLNGDLKALNQALKLDPKNTELLAQKHDVLRRNIEATEEKLQKLKQAQMQMGNYNSLTDEQKQSYNALSLEIAKSENALKEMNAEMKKTSGIDMSKVKDGLEKVGKVALDVSKKLLQVSTAVGGALAGVVGMGVKSYASLEQNLGGVETLFGKSADKVVANAKRAYETAGVSANEYMEGVTSFSASLLQSLGGDTDKAADIADMAFQDMSDNANKFGTDMSSIQNAYQGFAKQNYTMLDNLKLGYGGTKTEMERLLSDAQKITGVKYDIKNLDDVYEAIHVIQDEMGVTGTTFDEAKGTISGSLNAMKSAFDNFLNGSGSPEALSQAVTNFLTNIGKTIGQLAPSILSGIVTLIQNLLPQVVQLLIGLVPQLVTAVQNLINSVCMMITQNTTAIATTVTSIINQLIMFITTNLPLILDVGIKVLLALVDGITGAIPTLAEALPQLITTIINVLISNIPLVLQSAIQLLLALIQAIPVIVTELVNQLPTIVETIVNVLIQNFPMMLKASIQILMALVKAIPTIIIQLQKVGPTIIVSLVKTLWSKRGEILTTGKNLLLQLKDGIVNNLGKLMEKVREIPSKVKNWITEKISELKDVGTNFVKGIWDGISNSLDWIKGKLKDWVGNVVKFCKKILGIKSPSKVMADEVGHWMGEGIGVGFVDAMDDVEKQMASSIPIDSLQTQVSSAMSGLSRGISNSINPQINPNITYDMNYNMMANAMKDAMSGMEIELDDREVGKFVTKTITEEIYN